MSILRIGKIGSGEPDTLTLQVSKAIDGTGNLHNGAYAYRYSHRTLNLRPEMQVSLVLDDQTDLGLQFVDVLTTAPSSIGIALPENIGEPATLVVTQGLQAGLLVLMSVVLTSTKGTQGPPVVLFCDPQVGNDPKVSPT